MSQSNNLVFINATVPVVFAASIVQRPDVAGPIIVFGVRWHVAPCFSLCALGGMAQAPLQISGPLTATRRGEGPPKRTEAMKSYPYKHQWRVIFWTLMRDFFSFTPTFVCRERGIWWWWKWPWWPSALQLDTLFQLTIIHKMVAEGHYWKTISQRLLIEIFLAKAA